MDYEEESNSLEKEESSLDITPAEGVARPPSGTNSALLKSYTYATSLPTALEKDQECILGVDEAGRGPVLGTFSCLDAGCIIKNKDTKGIALTTLYDLLLIQVPWCTESATVPWQRRTSLPILDSLVRDSSGTEPSCVEYFGGFLLTNAFASVE